MKCNLFVFAIKIKARIETQDSCPPILGSLSPLSVCVFGWSPETVVGAEEVSSPIN